MGPVDISKLHIQHHKLKKPKWLVHANPVTETAAKPQFAAVNAPPANAVAKKTAAKAASLATRSSPSVRIISIWQGCDMNGLILPWARKQRVQHRESQHPETSIQRWLQRFLKVQAKTCKIFLAIYLGKRESRVLKQIVWLERNVQHRGCI